MVTLTRKFSIIIITICHNITQQHLIYLLLIITLTCLIITTLTLTIALFKIIIRIHKTIIITITLSIIIKQVITVWYSPTHHHTHSINPWLPASSSTILPRKSSTLISIIITHHHIAIYPILKAPLSYEHNKFINNIWSYFFFYFFNYFIKFISMIIFLINMKNYKEIISIYWINNWVQFS